MTFLHDVRIGVACLDDFPDYVERWHVDPKIGDMELHEYLGMTWAEYRDFMEFNALPEQLRATGWP
jgi:hypothetical protein